MSLEFNNVLDWSIFLAIISILVVYFGKLKSLFERDFTSDKFLEYFYGFIIFILLVLVPIMIMGILLIKENHSLLIMFLFILIIVFFFIYKYLLDKTKNKFLSIIGMILLLSSYYLSYICYQQSDILYLISAIFLAFGISTLIVSNWYAKERRIKIKLSDGEFITGKIIGMSGDFIKINTNRKNIIINKSHIISVEEIR